jgi:AAA15 family ATPase/GTPase
MNIISKVEINYFRSIYSASFNSVNHLNVFVGGNDAGKSNILRALNLFFNGKTELNTPYDFFQDITKYRVEEAREAKGRVTLWVKITFRNIDNWSSLPKTFYIKKSWDRNGDITLTHEKGTKLGTITKFLNKITFHYVPAIRGRETFSYYLGMVHDCLLNDTKAGLADASTAMTKRINEAVDDMSENIKEQLGFESKIEIPQNFRNLFEALDFSTKYGIFDVPLQKRGDGIQARHIPHILDFIADQDSKHHIWAYEEPENSLEMSNAFNLAEQFEQKFSKENQIFLTTHSPAFYDLSSEKVSRWLVTSGQYKDTEHLTSNAIPVSVEDENPDDRLGIAELVKERAKEIYLSHDALEKNILRLEGEISTYTKPVVVTEGKYDVTIIKKAWEKLYPDEDIPFDVTSCSAGVSEEDEQAGAKQLQTYLDSILYSENKARIGIFDNDKAGIDYFHRLRRYKKVDSLTKTHEAGQSHALLLPKPPSDELYWPTSDICIEFLFKKEHLTEGYVKRVYLGADGKEASEQQATILDDEIDPEKLESLRSLFKQEYKIRSNRKKHFAETKINNYPPEAFELFVVLFDNIKAVIQD